MIGTIRFYFTGILVSILPSRYRGEWQHRHSLGFARATMLSGLIEAALALSVLVLRFIGGIEGFILKNGMPAVESGLNGMPVDRAMAGIGVLSAIGFITQPFNAFLFYLIVEGLFRAIAALVTEETIGSLPLLAVAAVHNRIDIRHFDRANPLVPDQVLRGDGTTHEWKVLSSRPRDWHSYITVRYRGEFYQMFKEEAGSSPRPFVYYLRKPPIGHLAAVIRDYSPEGTPQRAKRV